MSSIDSIYQRSLYLSPEQQDLLVAALSSADQAPKNQKGAPMKSEPYLALTELHTNTNMQRGLQAHRQPLTTVAPGQELFESPTDNAPGSADLGFGGDDSPFLDFDFDVDFDPDETEDLIGDLPSGTNGSEEPETREKRKSIDGNQDNEEGGKKRKENEEKVAKKPGRKPLTSEPTTKRKAQNRAAQRAFRERKEKHLKDLETKVEELEQRSESTDQENNLLRAQVARLQVELREYRKRLSWIGNTNGPSSTSSSAGRGMDLRNNSQLTNANDFSFDFPKFGDLPSSHMFNNGTLAKTQGSARASTTERNVPGVLGRNSIPGTNAISQNRQLSSGGNSPATSLNPRSSVGTPSSNGRGANDSGIENFGGLYDKAANPNTNISYPASVSSLPLTGIEHATNSGYRTQNYGSSNVSNSDSPSSSESQPCHVSSMATSPEPSLNSPSTGKMNEYSAPMAGNNTFKRQFTDGEKSFYEKLGEACGCVENPVPAALSGSNHSHKCPDQNNASGNTVPAFDWLVEQNGGQFDPVLFNDYRDPQEAVLSQEFGGFFNDAFPLNDFNAPLNTFGEAAAVPPPKNLIQQIDKRLEGDEEEVVPAEDRSQMMTCTKIWDRLQSMEKFRNGEIDVDSLCTELRTKARCSEGGVVVNQSDVEDIMSRAT
ncbi:hypothetical protein AJ80_00509 [Polytolypa hystricis UAMH7299]|uniref:BZIP domain-containing protein n=1 Tax=Polytolypa hystricis (strain UAMH7299) TaxID=1447883 RepID=A0A2B7Z3T7_POLH7|nr:hypothetical protein AJ80_00509 [Polytolypa hystricis UAMH7299]